MTLVYGFGNRTTLAAQTFTNMRAQIDELQRQMATGKISDTYGGLGVGRGLDLSARSRLSAIEAFRSSIADVDLRVTMMNTALDRVRAVGNEVRSETRFPLTYELIGGGLTAAQRAAGLRLDEALSLLNERAGDRFLFSGRATDSRATVTGSAVLDGTGTQAGLRQVMAERLMADRGADGRGRLDAPAAAGSVVTLAEDGDHPFGFKLASVTADFPVTVTPNAGPPPSIEIDLGVANPPDGGRLIVRLNMPDGTSADIELIATTESPAPEGHFTAGATVGDTAQNLAAAIDTEVQALARTELAAASAMKASDEFFIIDADNPPQRVDGPPFENATAMRDGTIADTVHWYVGDDATDNPRATVKARIDDSITVDYGVRANEEGIRRIVQNIAVFSAMTFSSSDPDARDRYFALAQRVGSALDQPGDGQKIDAIQTEIVGASLAANSAKQRLTDREGVLQGLIDDIENVSPEEVGLMMLTLSTRLQATMQTTAMLSQFTLLDFI